jgi:glucose-6-phosphate dehydrogenase assembly protein OpcA
MADAVAAAPVTAAERFSRGEPVEVPIDRIERALTDLWQAASRAGGEDGGGAVSRAALWNVVVPTRAQHLPRTKMLVDELAPLLPARVLVLVEEPEAAADAHDEGVRATIETNVVARSSGARVVYSEEITLHGRRGDARFGALVRALQIPGLPTATLWSDPQMPEALLRRQLLPAADRLVLDTGFCGRPRQLLEVQRCADLAGGTLPVADLGWLRLRSFRVLFAGLFDAPVGGGPLGRARRVTISHRPGAEASALLYTAWLAATLDWLFAAAEALPADGGVRFRFDRADKGASEPVLVTVIPSSGSCGTSGLVAVELEAPSDAGDPQIFAVRRTQESHATLTLPIAPPRVVKLDPRRDAELTVAALGPAGRDPLFARCLSLAARLATVATGA